MAETNANQVDNGLQNRSGNEFTYVDVNGTENINLFSSPIEGKVYDFSKVTKIEKLFFPEDSSGTNRSIYCVRVDGATIPLTSLLSTGIKVSTADETLASIKGLKKYRLLMYRKSYFVSKGHKDNRSAIYEWKKETN